MEEYNILFSNESKYKGMIHLAVLNQNKELKSLGYCEFDKLQEKLENLTILKSRNYYITANKMKRYTQRKTENLFSLNNIVLDFDIHQRMNQNDRISLIEDFVWYMKKDLLNVMEPYNIPKPNIIHFTGRGIQIWWHIIESSSKLLFLYHKVIDKLVIVFKEFLEEYQHLNEHIEIDAIASKNAVGLFRLFNTYNTHTNTKTYTEILHSDSIDLNNFNSLLSCLDCVKKYEIDKQNKAKLINLKKSYNNSKNVKTKNNNYINLHKKRIALIKKLANERHNNVGERDIMLFLAFNAAIQFLPIKEAQNICIEINNSFSLPLKNIDYIFKEINSPYKFCNKTFFEWLNISDYEYETFIVDYLKSAPNSTRDSLRTERKNINEKRKNTVRDMINNGYKYKQISEKTGFSLSTIYRISKAMKE